MHHHNAFTDLLPTSRIPGPRWMTIPGGVWRQVQFDRDPVRFMYRLRGRYGNLVRYQNILGTFLFAFGPEYNKQLHQETDLFYSRPFLLPGRKTSSQHRLRQSIFSLNEESHRQMRHDLLPVFQRSKMPAYHRAVEGHIRHALGEWKPGQRRNLHRDMHLLVWSIVRDLLYGLDAGAASEELHEAMEHWMFQTFSPWVRSFPFDLPLTPFRRMRKEADRLEQKFLRLMERRRDAGADGEDALSVLLRLRDAEGRLLPLEELVGHALILFLVAYETTGNTLTWTLFLLSQFPDIQHDLLDEMAPLGQAPAAADLDRLPLLGRVLKESMRLLPAVPYSRRLASRDGNIGRYAMPKRTRILFSHYMTHHLPDIYPDPEAFLPSRWETIAPSPAEYLPFGAGVRTCLGASLAQFVIKMAVSIVLPQWKLTIEPNARIDRHLGISLGPRNGIPVIIEKQDRLLSAAPISGNIHDMVRLGIPGRPAPVRRAA